MTYPDRTTSTDSSPSRRRSRHTAKHPSLPSGRPAIPEPSIRGRFDLACRLPRQSRCFAGTGGPHVRFDNTSTGLSRKRCIPGIHGSNPVSSIEIVSGSERGPHLTPPHWCRRVNSNYPLDTTARAVNNLVARNTTGASKKVFAIADGTKSDGIAIYVLPLISIGRCCDRDGVSRSAAGRDPGRYVGRRGVSQRASRPNSVGGPSRSSSVRTAEGSSSAPQWRWGLTRLVCCRTRQGSKRPSPARCTHLRRPHPPPYTAARDARQQMRFFESDRMLRM